MPALCPIHVRKSRAQWSRAAEFYGFSQFIISFMFIPGASDVFRWFVMAFGFAILICIRLFFSKDGLVEFQERNWYPRAIPHMWCHLALQVHHQFGSIKLHRLAPSEKGYWCIPKPENLARSLGILEFHVEVLTFSLPINSIPYCKRQFDCLNNCLRWKLLLPLDPPKLDLAWNFPWESSIYFSSRLATWEMTNEMRATMPHPCRGWNLRGHQVKTWRCDIVRYLKYHKYAMFLMVRIFQMAPVLIT